VAICLQNRGGEGKTGGFDICFLPCDVVLVMPQRQPHDTWLEYTIQPPFWGSLISVVWFWGMSNSGCEGMWMALSLFQHARSRLPLISHRRAYTLCFYDTCNNRT
jgi:hypothetical protein